MSIRRLSPAVVVVALASLVTPARAGGDGLVTSEKGEVAEAKADAGIDDSKAPAEQDALKVFVGNWRCDGTINTDTAADVAQRITLNVKPELGGRWLRVSYDEQKSKDNGKPTSSQELWGYSAASSTFVMNGADNKGGFHDGSSTGFVGARFTWIIDSSKNGKRAKLRYTFEKKSDKELGLEVGLDPTATGDQYRIVFEGACKR